MSVNVDGGTVRRRTRGLFSRLFFGGDHNTTTTTTTMLMPPPPDPSTTELEQQHAVVVAADGGHDAMEKHTESETMIVMPTRPSYTRPLPSGPELANDIRSLRSFVLPQPTAESDECLLELLRQLCHQFLGGPPRDRLSRYSSEIDALYQGAPPRLDLQDALRRLVGNNNNKPEERAATNHNNSSADVNNNNTTTKADERTRVSLELLYRHIMIMIKALMIHLYMYRLIPDDKNVGTMHNWYAVLGNLETIRITIVNGSDNGQVDLHDAPRYWEELIERTVAEIQKCLRTLHSAEEQALTLKTALAVRDKESDELRRRFDPSALELERMQGERAYALEALRNVTSVTSILHNEAATRTPTTTSTNNNNMMSGIPH
jgi:hypothetical protein